MSVYKKLAEARTKFHSLELKKSGENKFANYRYFELGDFLVPALEVFQQVGLCSVTTFTNDTATMRIFDVDDPAQSVEFTSPMGSAALKGCHEVQNIGAVETYQRRYLWTVALEIVEHDALDAVTGDESKLATYSPTQLKEFTEKLNANDPIEFALFWRHLKEPVRDGLYNSFPKGEKMNQKKRVDDLDREGLAKLKEIKEAVQSAIEKGDEHAAIEELDGLSETAIKAIRGKLTAEELAFLDETEVAS